MYAFSGNTAFNNENTGIPSALAAEPVSESFARWTMVRAYGFALGGFNFLLPPGLYSELIKDPSWAPLPNVSSHCSGVLNLRGNVIPLYQLAAFIEGSEPLKSAPYALLIGAVGQAAAILLEVKPLGFNYAQLELSNDFGLAPASLAHCVRNTFRDAGKVWFELNHDALFLAMAG
jgi:twitching motility protein PilI